jgi:hypothetical protein
MGRHHTKTGVVVGVVDVVVVAVRTTGVPLIVVERTAAQHTGVESVCPVAKCDANIIRQKFPPYGGGLIPQSINE